MLELRALRFMDGHREGARPLGELMRREPGDASVEIVREVRAALCRREIAPEDEADIAVHARDVTAISEDEDGLNGGCALDELAMPRLDEPFCDGLVQPVHARGPMMLERERSMRVKMAEELGERGLLGVEELSKTFEIFDDNRAEVLLDDQRLIRIALEGLAISLI